MCIFMKSSFPKHDLKTWDWDCNLFFFFQMALIVFCKRALQIFLVTKISPHSTKEIYEVKPDKTNITKSIVDQKNPIVACNYYLHNPKSITKHNSKSYP